MITVRSTINLAHQSVPEVIPVVQGDTGRSILFTLADFTIPAGATARYFITKPSGLAVYNDATIDGNNVLVDLTAQSIAEAGDAPGQVRISVGDEIVTSFDFILHVDPFRGIDAVESSTEANIFDQAVAQAAEEFQTEAETIAAEVIESIPADYTALSNEVDDLNSALNGYNSIKQSKLIIVTDFESGLYSNQTGEKVDTTAYCRSTGLIRINGGVGIRLKDSTITNTLYAVFFDNDENYITYTNLSNYPTVWYPCIAPKNAVFMGINYAYASGESTPPAKLEFELVNGKNILTVSYSDVVSNGIVRKINRVLDNNGVFSGESSTYGCIFIPNPNFKYAYVNANLANQAVYWKWDGTIGNLTAQNHQSYGKVYELTEDIKYIGFNVYQKNGYVNFIYDEDALIHKQFTHTISKQRLTGKVISAVGDSITFLDEEYGYGNQNRIYGYQAYLRSYGANVKTYGYSGYAYTHTSNEGSIVDSIINNNVDFTYDDIVILFGGLNDERISAPIGDENTTYTSPNIDVNTFIGAIGKLVKYIRNQNPEIELYICTLTPSYDEHRTYSAWKAYNDAIFHCADFWSIPVIDTAKIIGAFPYNSNFGTYFYDSTHPNQKGMKRLGRGIAKFINDYYSEEWFDMYAETIPSN